MVDPKIPIAFTEGEIGFILDMFNGKVDLGWDPNLRRLGQIEDRLKRAQEALTLRRQAHEIAESIIA